jgi:hypothetical protein
VDRSRDVYNYYSNCLASKEQVSTKQDHKHSYIATMSDNVGDRAEESREEEQAEEVDNVAMETIRQALGGTTLKIGKRGDEDEDEDRILADAQSFVRLSLGNGTIQEVVLYLYYENSIQDYTALCELVNMFGNLEALRVVTILSVYGHEVYDDDDGERERVESLYQQAVVSALGRPPSHRTTPNRGMFKGERFQHLHFHRCVNHSDLPFR